MPRPPQIPQRKKSAPKVTKTQSAVDKATQLFQQGFALHQQGRLSEARSVYEAVLEINAKHFDALNLSGTVEAQLGKFEVAVDLISRAIAINSNEATCYNNLGNALAELKQPEAALANYDKAIQLKPDYVDAHSNRGTILLELKQFESALASFEKALQLKPDFAQAYHNRGNANRELKQLEAALASYETASELNPGLDFILGDLLHTKMYLCDWRAFKNSVNELSDKLTNNLAVSTSFPTLALTDALATHYQAASIWSNVKCPFNPALGPIPKSTPNDKIRIGYYSADFHNHATAYLMAELFERHDKARFEVIGFSFGPVVQDAMRQRIEAAFSQFLDVRLQSDKDVALLSRTMGIDIAIDLKGYTGDARPGIFSYRAAPIQISYLGYPGTMAAEYIDYLIADPTLVPEESQKHYSEKIIYLPDSYQVNDRRRVIADTVYSRDALGLPHEGFVFCCFNYNYKITPPTFDGWMRILHAVPGSVLWLFEGNATAAFNLRKEAQARGIDPQRLVFAKRMDLPEHLARHRAADLFIDTLPYNAHTTASDALWAGLPVLTCMGESFASRVAGSLLNAIGMPELVTTTQADYEALAIDLALNPSKLAALKVKLEKNRLTTPLFDTPRFTKHLEAAYTQVYQRYRDDLPPEHVYVGRLGTTVDTVKNTGEIEALFQQGFALHQQGKLSEASSVYEKVLSINPKHFDALNMYGTAEAQLGNFEAAVDLLSRAIAINPIEASCYNNRGGALLKLMRQEAALADFDEAIRLEPNYADANNNWFIALQDLKRPDDKILNYGKLIQRKPDYADAYFSRGNVLLEIKQLEAALADFDKAIEIEPNHANAYNSQGYVFIELTQPELALASFNRAIQLNPNYADAYLNRGATLNALKQPELALASYDKAIQLRPDNAIAYMNQGDALSALKQLEAAFASYDKAIQLKPDFADAYWNKSLALLLSGAMTSGFQLYEWRWKKKDTGLIFPDYPQPLWLGDEPLAGKTILLHSEQGLGDTLQFCRYAMQVKALGANALLTTPKTLMLLMQHLPWIDHVLELGQALPVFDYHCPLLSLPLAFKTDLATIPSPGAYLRSDPAKVQHWARILGDKTKPRVGLVWSGNIAHTRDHERSIRLDNFSALLPEGLEYICLQKELRDTDSTALKNSSIRYFGADIADFSDTAALCELMDVVVSVDTSVAHLSGALGKATWVLLPYVPDWRWLLDRDDSPWYTCVRLYRQDESRTWDSVLDRVAGDLRTLAGVSGVSMSASSDNVGPLFQQGFALHQQGKLSEASLVYEKVLTINPKHFDALNMYGTAEAQLGNFEAAVDLLSRAIAINPIEASCYNNRGGALLKLMRQEAALADFGEAIQLEPNYADAYNNWLIALQDLKRPDDKILNYGKLIQRKPDYADAYFSRGNVLLEIKQLEAALADFDKAIEIEPNHANAYNSQGYVFMELTQPELALASFNRAIQLNPDYADAYLNRGAALNALKQPELALASYDKAIQLRPDNAIAYMNQGNALSALKQLEAAFASYGMAIQLRPDYAAAYCNRGNAFRELKQTEAALANYDKAIEINPTYALAHSNRGDALLLLRRPMAALVSIKTAFHLQPNMAYLLGLLAHTQMQLGDWQNFENILNDLSEKLKNNIAVSSSFPTLALTDALATHYQAASSWLKDKCSFNPALGSISKSTLKDKIRIGYYSADFHNHATTYLMAELFERHDQARFEVIGFSFGPVVQDTMRQRLEAAFSRFIDVRLQSDKDVAQLSRTMGIDIAIDLKGYTTDSRPGIFSYRAAPIQISYLGYPGTMAAEYIDYLIADPTLVPVESQKHYSEKIIYLPDSYQVNDRHRAIADTVYSRDALGLPPEGFVFCCFNNNYKITPPTFDGWMRILHAVPSSVLWLLEDNATAAVNLRKEAQARGIDPQRLVFAKRLDLPEHLARHRAADLFIDTLPCNAHTTASDALWAGLPVLTCMGESFASRVAGSLLNAVGMPELITATQADYEALAIDLALNPAKLAALKAKLEKNRLTTPLFDTPRFTKHLEAAYTQVYQRYRDDLPPEHVYVKSDIELIEPKVFG